MVNTNTNSELIDRINSMYVDVSYMTMLNGFKELGTNSTIGLVKEIWRFCVNNPICPKKDYQHFIWHYIGGNLRNTKAMYTKYAEQLLKEMIQWLNEKLVIAKKIEGNDDLITLEPRFDLAHNQFVKFSNNNYDTLTNTDIYEDTRDMMESLKDMYVKDWKRVYFEHAESFKRKYGFKYSDVEKWSYEQWVDFETTCREDGIRPIDLKRSVDYVEREVGRPKGMLTVQMVDADTEEIAERFDCRESAMTKTGISKSRLSKCISSVKNVPNDKSKWSKFNLNGKKFWFIEEMD